jgi:hypothetical protein
MMGFLKEGCVKAGNTRMRVVAGCTIIVAVMNMVNGEVTKTCDEAGTITTTA